MEARREAARLYEEYMTLEEAMSSDSTESDFRRRDDAFAAYEERGLLLAVDENGIVIRCAISGVPILDDELDGPDTALVLTSALPGAEDKQEGDARPEMIGIAG
jgi:hypothetical protein